jgi:hypothetical protein
MDVAVLRLCFMKRPCITAPSRRCPAARLVGLVCGVHGCARARGTADEASAAAECYMADVKHVVVAASPGNLGGLQVSFGDTRRSPAETVPRSATESCPSTCRSRQLRTGGSPLSATAATSAAA